MYCSVNFNGLMYLLSIAITEYPRTEQFVSLSSEAHLAQSSGGRGEQEHGASIHLALVRAILLGHDMPRVSRDETQKTCQEEFVQNKVTPSITH